MLFRSKSGALPQRETSSIKSGALPKRELVNIKSGGAAAKSTGQYKKRGAAATRNGQYKKRGAAATRNGQYKKRGSGGAAATRNGQYKKRGRCRNEKWSVKRSEEHTSELQSPVPISYAVFCLKKKTNINSTTTRLPIHTPHASPPTSLLS